MSLDNVEKLELKYLEEQFQLLKDNLSFILDALRSRIRILSDWYTPFRETARKKYESSDLDRGAERTIGKILAKKDWRPTSAPIGSDFFYETGDAFIHTEIKTALVTNPSDYNGVFDVGENQTSYPAHIPNFAPRLPTRYNKNTRDEKLCLTYAVLIVHVNAKRILQDNLDQNPVAISVYSIPNGELYEVYGEEIIRKGKQKKGHFRCKFADGMVFKALTQERAFYRLRVPWLNKAYLDKTIEDMRKNRLVKINVSIKNLFRRDISAILNQIS